MISIPCCKQEASIASRSRGLLTLFGDDLDEVDTKLGRQLMRARGRLKRPIVGLGHYQHHDVLAGTPLQMLKARLHVRDGVLAVAGKLGDKPAHGSM
jgi:hypothetical protein